MATSAPAAEETEVAEEPKKKSPIVLIIAGVVGLIVLIIAVVLGTLFLTGYFNPKPVVDAEHAEAAADGHGAADGGHGDKKGDAKPSKKTKDTPELTRFEYTYLQIEREFLVNVSGSKKVMSVQLAVMTHYDDRVFENVKKHDFAIRSAVMDVMRQTVETELPKPDFRKDLGVKIRDAMNTLLEKYEDFGGIEEVMFTSFIVQ
jgi:flagellar FliL protein